MFFSYLTELETSRHCYIGWLQYTYVIFSNRQQITKELRVIMKTPINFQLVSHEIVDPHSHKNIHYRNTKDDHNNANITNE